LFLAEQRDQLATAGRRFFRGPGINNFDKALLKDVQMTASTSFQIRAEFVNVFIMRTSLARMATSTVRPLAL
jgi:hypothetical protein